VSHPLQTMPKLDCCGLNGAYGPLLTHCQTFVGRVDGVNLQWDHSRPFLAFTLTDWPIWEDYNYGRFDWLYPMGRHRKDDSLLSPNSTLCRWSINMTFIQNIQQQDFWAAPVAGYRLKPAKILGCECRRGDERVKKVLGPDYYRWFSHPMLEVPN
jgi:hypothetical protein